MSYASIAEAHGEDFASRVNNVDFKSYEHFANQLNPTRSDNSLPGARYGDNIVRSGPQGAQDARHRAIRQSRRDRKTHRESFTDVSPEFNQREIRPSEFRPWGDRVDIEQEEKREMASMTPQEYLNRSLAGNGNLNRTMSGFPPGSVGQARVMQVQKFKSGTPNDHLVYKPTGNTVYAPFNPMDYKTKEGGHLDPVGYGGPMMTYGDMEKSPCQDYFYHLDTCRRCQRKLKKRVARYFRALQRNHLNPLLPGAQGLGAASLDKELFTDYDDMDEMMNLARKPGVLQNKRGELCLDPPSKPIKGDTNEDVETNQMIQENFGNIPTGYDFTPAMYLLLFGLFVIYALDNSRKGFLSGGGLKIIRG
jgi:hypothetical protein